MCHAVRRWLATITALKIHQSQGRIARKRAKGNVPVPHSLAKFPITKFTTTPTPISVNFLHNGESPGVVQCNDITIVIWREKWETIPCTC